MTTSYSIANVFKRQTELTIHKSIFADSPLTLLSLFLFCHEVFFVRPMLCIDKQIVQNHFLMSIRTFGVREIREIRFRLFELELYLGLCATKVGLATHKFL